MSELREIGAEELRSILDAHKLWRETDGREGARANLARANLAGANLVDANLVDANLADADLAGADLTGANLEGAYLARADLVDADLARADLVDADLAGAYLAGANLVDADLAGADLTGAYLARANLVDANLVDANLVDANLADADLAGADLTGANLEGAYLARADLAGAYLAGAYLEGARNVPSKPAEAHDLVVPKIEQLNSKILAAVEGEAAIGTLDMRHWHSCDTTHCMAGWAIHLAGKEGYELEAKVGPFRAGAMIFRASTGRAPHFFAPNDRALRQLRERAAKEQEQSV